MAFLLHIPMNTLGEMRDHRTQASNPGRHWGHTSCGQHLEITVHRAIPAHVRRWSGANNSVQALDPTTEAQPWLLIPCAIASDKLLSLHVSLYSHLEN